MSSDNKGTTGRDGRLIGYKLQQSLYKFGIYLSTALILLVMGLPIYWMFQTSIKTRAAIQSDGVSLLPLGEEFTLRRYEILQDPVMVNYIINSTIVTIGTVVLSVLISLIAGYSLARFNFRGKIGFARFILTGYMFSAIVIGLPLFLLYRQIGFVNTHIGLILVLTATTMPFCVWIMWKYIQTLPTSLEESAWIVGASRWRGVVDIILPQCFPGIIAVALFSFAIAWNDFTFAQILLPAQESQTFPPGLLSYINQSYATAWGDLMAAGFFMSVPPLLFAYFLQSYLLKGFELR